jgi:hypothetical protein
MPKHIDDVIVPDRRRSIRDIPIPENRRRGTRRHEDVTFHERLRETEVPTVENNGIDNVKRNPRRKRRWGKWLLVLVALLILGFAVLSFFNGATFAYVPKSLDLSFANDTFVAKKTGDQGLFYSVVKLSKEKGVEVPASGQEEVTRKAAGKIIVYNDYSAQPQKFIATTRFETPGGLVYRALNDITVPGKKTVAGASQPGTVEVDVVADVAGTDHNIGLSDFTLPGLKGTPRYANIYARSKTEMTGGYAGTEKVVDAEDKTDARAKLESELRNELISEARAQVPEGFVLLSSLSSISYEELPQTASPENPNGAIFNLKGNLYGVMFKRSDLAAELSENKVTLAEGEIVDIEDLDSLSFAFTGDDVNLLTSNEIEFSVTGQSLAIWRTDEVALKTDLLGRNKQEINSILKNYPTITNATATTRPFWKNTFPKEPGRIKVKALPVR